MMRSGVMAGCLVALAGARSVCAQTGAKFDSASIKTAKADARGYSIRPLPGRIEATNCTLKQLVSAAYHIYDFQVSGGPKWMDSERYDVEAKAADGERPTNAQLESMLQKLLAERFQLALHDETRDLPVYALDVAKGGPKFQPTKDTQQAPYFRLYQRRQITARNSPLSYLTEVLSQLLGRPVVDNTGLNGVYDFTLEWAPDEAQTRSPESPVTIDSNVPSLAAAIQEQLGLRMQGQKGPVKTLVIDHAEKASVN
jgi:uncharacterized protein (TIGR03435 family)